MPESQAVTRCPACAGTLPLGGRFCPSCGMPVVSATRTQTRKNVVILFTILVLVVNLLVDLAYVLLDPRPRVVT